MNTTDIRTAQAEKYWGFWLAQPLGYKSFPDFLAAVPEVPASLLEVDERFPLLVLVLPRNDKLTLTALCWEAKVDPLVTEADLLPYDVACEDFAEMKWIRMHDGRRNQNLTVLSCRSAFQKGEYGLTAFQAVCAVIHYPQIVAEWDGSEGETNVLCLPGTAHVNGYGEAVYLSREGGFLELNSDSGDWADPRFGAASFRV